MKLGILNATKPQDEAAFQLWELANFQAFFDRIPHNCELIEYRVTEGEFPVSTACDAYLITGSPQGVYDPEPWIAELATCIRGLYVAEKRLVGICFGHQMLAHTLGGHTEKSAKGWGMGLRRFTITAIQPWMDPRLETGQLYFCHQDQVARLPENAQRLAGNAFCPNAIFTIGKQVLGIQGHPEFSEEYMRALITELAPVAGAEVTLAAAATLAEGAPDDQIMARWIINFIKQ
ncbi:MAG: hypothetical protein R3C14_21960 [Caldilineaceae bacterium]